MIGDLIFVKPTNVMGKLIAFFGNSKYSHVAISMSDDDTYLAEINLGYTFDIRLNKYPSYDIYGVTEPYNKNQLMNIVYGKVGMEYDVLDIIRILFKVRLRSTPKKLICSESVMQCYGLLGIVLTKEKIPSIQDLIDGGKLMEVK